MSKIAIIHHSGYGHTAVVADAVAQGARDAGAEVSVIRLEGPGQDFAPALAAADGADAIIFGSPTYMGDVSATLKAFFEASSKAWASGAWRDKIAAGFTNSLSLSGDKSNTLGSILVFAMQHGMIWVGTGLPPGNANGNSTSAPDAVNRLSYSVGLATQSDNASPEVTPSAGDRETARLFGARIARVAAALKR
ncbi:MAG: flavodoxin family protein [Hyphomonadaceae bacterium]|nr:flavodoxin family protein [Hyphomonadaceae bacterium]